MKMNTNQVLKIKNKNILIGCGEYDEYHVAYLWEVNDSFSFYDKVLEFEKEYGEIPEVIKSNFYENIESIEKLVAKQNKKFKNDFNELENKMELNRYCYSKLYKDPYARKIGIVFSVFRLWLLKKGFIIEKQFEEFSLNR